MNEMRQRALTVVMSGLLVAASGAAQAAGFAIIEQSVKGLGSAFASGAAAAEDASTVFFNPAGMTRLDSQMVAAGHVIVPSAEFSNGSSIENPAFNGGASVALTGGNGGDAGVVALAPNFYYTRRLGDSFAFGLGVNAPFGLKTKYDPTWIGRYHAITSSVKTININPSVAYDIGNSLSIGVGVSAQYIEARLTNAIDQSGVCLGFIARGLTSIGNCAGNGLTNAANPATDGMIDLKADDWSFGYNLGLLYSFSESTRVGLHYRSKISHSLEGNADFSGTAPIRTAIAATIGAAGGLFADQTARAKITVPESFSVSLFHQASPKLAVMADVTLTRWNRFSELKVLFDNGHPTNITPENWDNSMRYSLGASYRYTPKLTLRGGVAYDETPIPSETFRTPRIPGDDRTWITVGASYEASDRLTIDAGYAHLFVGNVSISNSDVNTKHQLIGTFDADVNIFSLQAQYTF